MAAPDLHEIERMIDRGETSVAVSILSRAVRDEPVHAAAYALLARAYEGESRFDEAIDAWRRVRILVPDSTTAVDGLQRALRLRLLRSSQSLMSAVAESLDLERTGPDAGADPTDAAPADSAPVETAADADAPVTDEPDAASPAEDDEPPHNLDELIRELESARIVPDPSVRPAEADEIEPDVDDVVSETLARIYANQRHYEEAARVYEQLAWQKPERADEFRSRAAELRARVDS